MTHVKPPADAQTRLESHPGSIAALLREHGELTVRYEGWYDERWLVVRDPQGNELQRTRLWSPRLKRG